MANSKSIGVAFEDQNITGADFVSAGTVYATGEIGYNAAAQGTVTQATSKSTGVTLNKSAGQITMNGAALAGATAVSFTLTNSTISAKDVVILTIGSGATATAYTVYVSSMAAGSAVITLRNLTASTSLSEAVVINYAIIHCA
jgi:hypothetical protein